MPNKTANRTINKIINRPANNDYVPNPIMLPISSIAFMGAPFLNILNISNGASREADLLNIQLCSGLSLINTLYTYLPERNKESAIFSLDYLLGQIDVTLNLLGLYDNDIDVNTIDKFISMQISNINSISDQLVEHTLIEEYSKIQSMLTDYKELVNDPKATITKNIRRDVLDIEINPTIITQLITATNLIPTINTLKANLHYLSNSDEIMGMLKEISTIITSLRVANYTEAIKIRAALNTKVNKFSTLIKNEKKNATRDYQKQALVHLENTKTSLKALVDALNKYIINTLSDTKVYTSKMGAIQTALDSSIVTLEALTSQLNEISTYNPDVVDSIYDIHNFIVDNLMLKNMSEYTIDLDNIKASSNIFNSFIMTAIKVSIKSLDTTFKYFYINKPRVTASKAENTVEYLLQSKEGRKDLINRISRVCTDFNNEILYEKTYSYRLKYKQDLEQAILDLSYKLDMTRKTENASILLGSSNQSEFRKTLNDLCNSLAYTFMSMSPLIRYVYQIFGLSHIYIDYTEYKNSLSEVNFSVKSSEGIDYTRKIGTYEKNLSTMRDLLKMTENSLYQLDYAFQYNIPLEAVMELV